MMVGNIRGLIDIVNENFWLIDRSQTYDLENLYDLIQLESVGKFWNNLKGHGFQYEVREQYVVIVVCFNAVLSLLLKNEHIQATVVKWQFFWELEYSFCIELDVHSDVAQDMYLNIEIAISDDGFVSYGLLAPKDSDRNKSNVSLENLEKRSIDLAAEKWTFQA